MAAEFAVNLTLAPEGDMWIAECDALPVVTEASSVAAVIERVRQIAPEIARLNGHKGALKLRFVLSR